MGGEKAAVDGVGGALSGSPPHGRGKVPALVGMFGFARITLAWAGKRRCTAACNGLCWDHPRMGGEKP